MFLNQLDYMQKTVFLQLAKHISRIDDEKIDSEEMLRLSRAAREMGLTVNLTDEHSFELSSLAQSFSSKESRLICLLELIWLAYANKEFDRKQDEFVNELARLFDIEETVVDQLENWVLDMEKLYQRGMELVSG